MKERKLRTKAHILTGDISPEFAQSVADHLNLPLEHAKVTHFANTEVKAEVEQDVRGDRVFVIQSHKAPVNESLMQQMAIINAAKRAAASEVIAVVPYRGYSRADRPDNSHESYMGPIALRMLAMVGASRILEVDPHAGQSAGFLPDFNTEYKSIPAHHAIHGYLEDGILDLSNLGSYSMTAPDSGRAKTLRKYADHYLGTEFAIVDKQRTGTNKVETHRVIGKVAGQHCILIDDMIDTGGTILQGAKVLRDAGATEVTLIATHGILSDPAVENLIRAKESGVIARVAVTDTLRLPAHAPEGLIDTISVAPLVAEAIGGIFNDKSVSNMPVFRD